MWKAAILSAALALAPRDVIGVLTATGLDPSETENVLRAFEVLSQTRTGRKILAEAGFPAGAPRRLSDAGEAFLQSLY